MPRELRAAISDLMALTGANDMDAQMSQKFKDQLIAVIKRNNPRIPAAAVTIVEEEIDRLVKAELATGELRDRIHAIYAKHFTLEEIRGLIAFNRSPLGQKANAVTPKLVTESLRLNLEWREKLLPILKARITERLREKDIEIN